MSAVLKEQVKRQVVLVTGADLADQAVELLSAFDLVYAGKTPTEDDLVALCGQHQPVAIIVRYGRITERVHKNIEKDLAAIIKADEDRAH